RNPIAYNPVRYPERAAARREVAIDRMLEVGALNEQEAAFWHAVPTAPQYHEVLPRPNDYFPEEVRQQLLADERLGATLEERRKAVYQGGLRVFTTFDPVAQRQALEARDSQLPLENGMFTVSGTDPETGQPNRGSAAIVSIEP